jgi:ABC-type sugar transport system substrate-binding protein
LTAVAAAVAAAVALAVAAAGCGDDRPSAANTAPPPVAGFTRVIGAGFTIDMPAGWPQPALDPAAFDRTAEALRAQNPRLAAGLDQARGTLDRGTRLFAIDPTDGSSVNLIVTEAGDRSLDDLVVEAVSQLEAVGASSLRQERTNVGSRRAARLQFGLPVTGTAGSLTVPETQYYVVHQKRLYVLTLFGDSPTLNTVAQSLRIS